MLVLVDADLLVYRCGFASEKMHYTLEYVDPEYGDTVWDNYTSAKDCSLREKELVAEGTAFTRTSLRVPEPESHALANARSMTDDIVKSCPGEVRVVLSGTSNFRYEVATIKPYKGNRDKAEKPVHAPAIRNWLKRNFDTVVTDHEEADDYLGYTQCAAGPDESVIVSIDKDLKMIPGLHYDFLKSHWTEITLAKADEFFWTQMLTGDSTDNIPGVPGIGPVRAKALLKGVPKKERYGVVRASYVLGYGAAADAALLENGRLLWIRRKEGELWEPR